VLRFGSRVVALVLALFVASLVSGALAPLAGESHGPCQDEAALALAGAAGGHDNGASSSDGDGMKCSHACHFLQHFQGSVDRSAVLALDRSATAYAALEPDAAPQRLSDARFHPPRFSARSA
jgi:hypothetical protein